MRWSVPLRAAAPGLFEFGDSGLLVLTAAPAGPPRGDDGWVEATGLLRRPDDGRWLAVGEGSSIRLQPDAVELNLVGLETLGLCDEGVGVDGSATYCTTSAEGCPVFEGSLDSRDFDVPDPTSHGRGGLATDLLTGADLGSGGAIVIQIREDEGVAAFRLPDDEAVYCAREVSTDAEVELYMLEEIRRFTRGDGADRDGTISGCIGL